MSATSTPKIEKNGADKKDDIKLEWTDTTENLLVSWADISTCYKWLHDQSFRMFQRANYAFSIPIIIMSTITGTLSVGMSSIVPEEWVHTAQIAVGGINIFTGIVSTLQNFFHYAQLSEAHFNAGVGWSKLHRNIAIELSVDRKYRKNADTFIRVCRADYDRLLEQSPTVPEKVIKKFKDVFKKNSDLIRPDICDHLQHLNPYVERDAVDIGAETDDLANGFSQSFTKISDSPKIQLTPGPAVAPSPRFQPALVNHNPIAPPPFRRASIARRKSDSGLHHLLPPAPRPAQVNISREAPSVKDLIRRFTLDGTPSVKLAPPETVTTPKTPVAEVQQINTPVEDQTDTEVELSEIRVDPPTPKADSIDDPMPSLRPKLNRKHKNLQRFDFKLDIKTDDEL